MPVPHTQTSGGARLAVMYITLGSIIDVWSALWLIWMKSHGDATDRAYFWCYGFLLTGLTLVIIGLALGRIGRSARQAEAPTDATAPIAMAPQPANLVTAAPQQTAPQGAAIHGSGQGVTPASPGGMVAPNAVLRR